MATIIVLSVLLFFACIALIVTVQASRKELAAKNALINSLADEIIQNNIGFQEMADSYEQQFLSLNEKIDLLEMQKDNLDWALAEVTSALEEEMTGHGYTKNLFEQRGKTINEAFEQSTNMQQKIDALKDALRESNEVVNFHRENCLPQVDRMRNGKV